jgi:cysteine desulfuration protein SufE
MNAFDRFLSNPVHRALVEEYHVLDSSEDRLAWLMERPSLHAAVSSEHLTDANKVPGCLSGLWLHGDVHEGRCAFGAKSESDMVQGISSFICDLYSSRTPDEVLEIGYTLVSALMLERLLSTTRKRAVSSTVSYILHIAREASGHRIAV